MIERALAIVGATVCIGVLAASLLSVPADRRALAFVAARVPGDALVVVDEPYSEHFGAILGTGTPTFLSVRDVERHVGKWPCTGRIYALTKNAEALPKRIRDLPREDEPIVVGDAAMLLTFARP